MDANDCAIPQLATYYDSIEDIISKITVLASPVSPPQSGIFQTVDVETDLSSTWTADSGRTATRGEWHEGQVNCAISWSSSATEEPEGWDIQGMHRRELTCNGGGRTTCQTGHMLVSDRVNTVLTLSGVESASRAVRQV